jgi:hypothetical protein
MYHIINKKLSKSPKASFVNFLYLFVVNTQKKGTYFCAQAQLTKKAFLSGE